MESLDPTQPELDMRWVESDGKRGSGYSSTQSAVAVAAGRSLTATLDPVRAYANNEIAVGLAVLAH